MKRSGVVGIELPDETWRFQRRGSTSLIYQTVEGVTVFTLEKLKLDWWRALGLLEHYTQEGEYQVSNQRRLPLYVARDLPVLSPVTFGLFPILEVIQRKRHPDNSLWWERLAHCHPKSVKQAARWLLDQEVDTTLILPDFSNHDFVWWRSEVTALDPFHDIRLGAALAEKGNR